jgi:DNA-binding CsgD family transcriptional regulator
MKNIIDQLLSNNSQLSFLNIRQRKIIIYLCFYGYSQKKICASLNISRSTVIKCTSDLKYIFEADNLTQLGSQIFMLSSESYNDI